MNLRTTLDDGVTDPLDWPMLIGGEWVAAADDSWTEVTCPSRDGMVLARVPDGKAADVDRAVQAAAAAQPAWAGLHFKDRQAALLKIADAIEASAEEFSRLTAQDTGNAIRTQARPETATLIALFRYFGGIAGEFKGRTLPAGDDQLQYTRLQPLGVVGAILPWNSPLMIAAMKLPAALATGNALVVKPAEDAPLTILKLAQVCSEFLPAGVLNVVTGLGETAGEAISQHPGIAKVSFTGSSQVGRHVAGVAGKRLAHVSLELGGKSPNIVFPSAATPERIEATAEGALLAMRFTRQGQSCTAGSRLFVHESVFDEFVEVLAEKVKALKVGDPLEEETDMGTIINETQYRQVCDYVEEGKQQEGVRVVLDGSGYKPEGLEGFYQGPTILANVDNSWRIAREEVFGPVLVAIPWSDVDDVVAQANDSHYGLAAFVWSQDLNEAIETAHRIDSGWVQVNQGGGQVIGQSYGGFKQSGIGREFSLEGAIESFTQTKQINIKLG
ncbi:MAG TPA: aldehyde dehydrogenase family protein [Intrasporangiaceae bacterium]|nr:aldehyde dehydrogenase family protein [Intrasporangiaceae bacterium]